MRKDHAVHVMLPASMQIDSFFKNDEHFLEVMKDARWRIIREFTHARSAPDGGSTPNCVERLDNRPSSLVSYLQNSMKKPVQDAIFSVGDLPRQFRTGKKWEQEAVAAEVRAEIFMRTVLIMKDVEHSLWYYNNAWSMPQSTLDGYLLVFEKAAKSSFNDERSFHGRARNWRRRTKLLRVAPGASVSYA